MALISMQADLEKDGLTPAAVLRKMDVLVNAMNKDKVRLAVEKLSALDVLPGLSMNADRSIIRAHKAAPKH
ncbi:hypothetical protein NPS53_09640 [Pseudomonas putida]|uniref:hypothetical protein n=1 Tax=Pseudomonas putida TaxID=303 RepID=UPI0023635361|nr:hypothetical protein [Pseudomonas putida]MDD2139840.1 hypothetical protein [Pseudomonas putida]HDS1721763.1 hypothetical protein [Pseudomonas putida]